MSSDLATYVKLCCGGVSPPLPSLFIGIVADVFLITSSTIAFTAHAGSRIVIYTYTYNIITITFTVMLSLPIAAITSQQEMFEGNFRHSHWRVHAHAERICLTNGEEVCARPMPAHAYRHMPTATCPHRVATNLLPLWLR